MSRGPIANEPPRLWSPVLAFATVYLIWGSTYLAIRFAVETLPPFLMAAARFLLAGAILYPLVRRRFPGRLTRRHWVSAAIVGTLMLLGGNGLVCWAEQEVPSGIAALLVATIPLWMIGLDWALYREPRPTRRVLLGLALGFVGVIGLVNPLALGGERLHLPSALAVLAACGFWGLGSLYSRRHDLPANAFLSTAMQMLTGGVSLLICGTIVGEWGQVDLTGVSLASLLSLAYLVVFGSLIALSAYVWLLQNCSPAKVSTYAFVNPVVAVALGALFAGEPFSGRQAIAAAAIIGSTMLITLAGKKRESMEPRTCEIKAACTAE
ncbi:MAG: EamA family transporter [Phycisphaerales bacterium JB038]